VKTIGAFFCAHPLLSFVSTGIMRYPGTVSTGHSSSTGMIDQRLRCILRTLFLLVVLCKAVSVAQPAGLKLQPDPEFALQSKTGRLFLTPESPVPLDSDFRLDFDLMIEQPRSYGAILCLDFGGNAQVRLGYSAGKANDTSSTFVLAVNHAPTSAEITLPREQLHLGTWHQVSLTIARGISQIELVVDHRSAGTVLHSLPPGDPVAITFGPPVLEFDTPIMRLRNIRLSEGSGRDRATHEWPLDEESGEIAHDRIGSLHARQENALWCSVFHKEWRKRFEISAGNLEIHTFTNPNQKSEVFFVFRDSLVAFNVSDGTARVERFVKPRTGFRHRSIVDPTGILYSYSSGLGEVSRYDSPGRMWSPIDTAAEADGHYYAQLSFVNPFTGDVCAFGGYGWYKTSNLFQRFDRQSRSWVPLPIHGDTISPRMNAIGAYTADNSGLYIFGGFGNPSGRQEAGYLLTNDLFRLDFRTMRLTRIWESGGPMLNGVFDLMKTADTSSLYLVRQQEPDTAKLFQLWKISTAGPQKECIQDSLSIFPYHGVGYVTYDERSGQFIAYTLDSLNRKLTSGIYTLEYPPAVKRVLQKSHQHIPLMWWTVSLIGGGLVVIGTGFLFKRRSTMRESGRGIALGTESKGGSTASPAALADTARSQRRIIVFGRFAMVNGVDFTGTLPPKMQEMFLFLLLNTRKQHGVWRGASAQDITMALWPDRDIVSAKNVRGVTMKSLREGLESFGDVSVVFESREYRIDAGPNVDSEYHRFIGLIEELGTSTSPELLKDFVSLVGGGYLLAGKSYPWLDSLQADTSRIVSHLCLHAIPEVDEPLALKLADSVLAWDPINATAFRRKMAILAKRASYSELKAAYDQFADTFQSTFDKPFPHDLNEFM
jgi:hypothetical protein